MSIKERLISKESKREFPLGIILPITFLILWYSATVHSTSPLYPSPLKSLDAITALIKSGELQQYFQISLFRFGIGWGVGTLLGIAFGAILSSSKVFAQTLVPNIDAFRLIPLIGWIPLLIVWFGSGDLMRIMLIGLGAFFPMVISTYNGFRNVPDRFHEVGLVLGFGKLERLLKITLPAAIPALRAGTHITLGFAWTILVASEILTDTRSGLGFMLNAGRESFHLELVNAGILLLGATGFVLNFILKKTWNLVQPSKS